MSDAPASFKGRRTEGTITSTGQRSRSQAVAHRKTPRGSVLGFSAASHLMIALVESGICAARVGGGRRWSASRTHTNDDSNHRGGLNV